MVGVIMFARIMRVGSVVSVVKDSSWRMMTRNADVNMSARSTMADVTKYVGETKLVGSTARVMMALL